MIRTHSLLAGAPVTARPWRRFFTLATAVLVADQLSKLWAVARLTERMEDLAPGAGPAAWLARFWQVGHPVHRLPVTIFESWFHFRYVENPGAAWGLLANTSSALRTPFFLVLSLSAMGFILAYLRRVPATQRRLWSGLTLVFGGALGNFIDRVRLGYVIDFIDWHAGDWYTWPTFNVADAAISVGVGLLLLDTLLEGRRTSSDV